MLNAFLCKFIRFELASESPEVTLCVWRGYKPSINKKNIVKCAFSVLYSFSVRFDLVKSPDVTLCG